MVQLPTATTSTLWYVPAETALVPLRPWLAMLKPSAVSVISNRPPSSVQWTAEFVDTWIVPRFFSPLPENDRAPPPVDGLEAGGAGVVLAWIHRLTPGGCGCCLTGCGELVGVA